MLRTVRPKQFFSRLVYRSFELVPYMADNIVTCHPCPSGAWGLHDYDFFGGQGFPTN